MTEGNIPEERDEGTGPEFDSAIELAEYLRKTINLPGMVNGGTGATITFTSVEKEEGSA